MARTRGLYSFDGRFTLCFFVRIVVETYPMTIALNAVALRGMFDVQQRFFALIELASQLVQGFANSGASTW